MNYVDFDLNLLKIFLSIYENGGIVNASKKLYISQPAVTMSLKRLENVVGSALFLRLPKGIKPTEAGTKFYEYCKKAVKQIELALDNTKEQDYSVSSNINIGASHDLINYFIMPKIVEFSKTYPNVCINFIETIPNHLSKYIEIGDIDIAFLEDKKLQNNFECFEVTKLENCFFAKNDAKIINSNIQYATYKQNCGNFNSFENYCKNYEQIKSKYRVSNFDTMSKLVENDLCIGYAPKIYVEDTKFSIVKNKYKTEPTTINMCYLKEQDISFVCKEFIKMFK